MVVIGDRGEEERLSPAGIAQAAGSVKSDATWSGAGLGWQELGISRRAGAATARKGINCFLRQLITYLDLF